MRPCCLPGGSGCVNFNPNDEWICEAQGGTLGPRNACCFNLGNPSYPCSGTLQECWKCEADMVWCGPIENCCLPDLGFAYVESVCREGCSECGGHPVGSLQECVGTDVPVRPCCHGGQHCENITTPEGIERCLDDGGKLGPEGTCCAHATQVPFLCPNSAALPCWLCEWDDDIDPLVDYRTSCCFPELGFQWIPGAAEGGRGIYTAQCSTCLGEVGVSQEDCQEPPRVQECIEAGEDRIPEYENVHRWTLNTIDTVAFGLARVTQEWRQLEGDLGIPWDAVQGYTYGASTHLTRPRELDTPQNACGHAIGGLTMLDDGYVYMATCSLPDGNNRDSHRRSFGVLWTSDVTDPQLGIEKGYQYWITCIRLPTWTEILYRSQQLICKGGVPQ